MRGALVFIDTAAETEAVVEGTVLSVGSLSVQQPN